jgi:ubiquinone/menaquinone biosynthesis C-methylase UbiE
VRRAQGTPELLDGELDVATLEGNLRDLARANRWLGGASLSWRALSSVIGQLPVNHTVSVLDIGTGAADIPRSLTTHARAQARRLAVKAIDIRPEIVAAAAHRLDGEPDVQLALARAADSIDEPDSSFDVVHSSMVLHHLDMPEARRLLGEMARVARRAVIVNDLDRARRWWLAAWLLSRIASGNRYTRHDAPLSVQRAYRPNEIAALAAHAGLRERARFNAFPGYRYALVFS